MRRNKSAASRPTERPGARDIARRSQPRALDVSVSAAELRPARRKRSAAAAVVLELFLAPSRSLAGSFGRVGSGPAHLIGLGRDDDYRRRRSLRIVEPVAVSRARVKLHDIALVEHHVVAINADNQFPVENVNELRPGM